MERGLYWYDGTVKYDLFHFSAIDFIWILYIVEPCEFPLYIQIYNSFLTFLSFPPKFDTFIIDEGEFELWQFQSHAELSFLFQRKETKLRCQKQG